MDRTYTLMLQREERVGALLEAQLYRIDDEERGRVIERFRTLLEEWKSLGAEVVATQVAIRTHDMGGAVAELAKRGVIVTSRDGSLRAAFHYYTVPGGIDGLEEIRPLMVNP